MASSRSLAPEKINLDWSQFLTLSSASRERANSGYKVADGWSQRNGLASDRERPDGHYLIFYVNMSTFRT